MESNDNLEELLFAGLSERPTWSGFLRALAIRSGADHAFLAVEGSKPDASALAIVSPEPSSLEEISRRLRFELLRSLPFARPQLITTDQGEAAVVRCKISGDRSIWLVAEGTRLSAEACLVQLERLAPLLGHVLPLYELLADAVRERRVAEYVIEASGTGTILVEADGRLVSANAVAQSLMAEGGLLTVRDGTLRANNREATQHLLDAVAEMARRQSAHVDPRCYLPVALPDPGRLHPLTLIVRPGPPYGPVSAPLKRTAIITLRDPARTPMLPVTDLEQLFGLSPAEARLATRLVDGEAVEEAAIGLGISRNTARSQLQSIYMKIGVNRQGELVRLLLSSAASQFGYSSPKDG